MALPWPLAGAGIAALPKPGAWMVRVKQAMGVVILGTAVYYGYLAYGLFDNRNVEASAVSGSVQEKLAGGMDRFDRSTAWPAPSAKGSRCSSTSGRPGARTA